MKAVVAAFNQEKALVGAFSVITNLRMELFEALLLPRLVVCMASWTESECWGKNTDRDAKVQLLMIGSVNTSSMHRIQLTLF